MEVAGIVGGNSLGGVSWTRWMHPWRLLAGVCRLREEGKSVGGRTCGELLSCQGSYTEEKAVPLNSQLSLLTLHSVRLQSLSSPLSSTRSDLPYTQSMSKIFYR